MPKSKSKDIANKFKAVKVKSGFTYNSEKNSYWLPFELIKDLISKNV